MTLDIQALEAALEAFDDWDSVARKAVEFRMARLNRAYEQGLLAMPSVRALIRSHAEKVPCERPTYIEVPVPRDRPARQPVPCGTCRNCQIADLNWRLP